AMAVRELGITVTAVGNLEQMERVLNDDKIDQTGIVLVGATQTIEMCDEPTKAIRHKKDSSMVVGLRLLAEGEGDAFVSA
ncbi:MAG: phosphate--acyl-ACP acyltransferase, partial [Pygmaiobacter sp.]